MRRRIANSDCYIVYGSTFLDKHSLFYMFLFYPKACENHKCRCVRARHFHLRLRTLHDHDIDHDNDNDVDNDDNKENERKRAVFEPKYSRRWRQRQHICRAAGKRLVIPVSGHAGEGLNTYVWPMKLFLVVLIGGHEFIYQSEQSCASPHTSCFL